MEMIAWTTWNAAGYSVKTSKAHIESDENKDLALCGTRIPREGNGIEYTDESDGECKRCEKKAFHWEDIDPEYR